MVTEHPGQRPDANSLPEKRRRRRRVPDWTTLLLPLPLLLFVAIWQWYGSSSSERRFFYSTPADVFKTTVHDVTNGSLWKHARITAGEACAGFVLGNATGAIFGVILACLPRLARISRPYTVAAAAFPVFAIAPLTIIWFSDWGAKVALAFAGTVFIAMNQAIRGVEEINPLHLRRFKVWRAGRWATFRHLLWPASTVWIVNGLTLTGGAALLGAFIGEFISSDSGLGYMILRAAGVYDVARVIEGALAIVVIALLLDLIVRLIAFWWLHWRRV